ncbi:hypothetical protein D9M70_651860 [compost metagenome]
MEGMGAWGGRNWCRRSVTVCWASALPAIRVVRAAPSAARVVRRFKKLMGSPGMKKVVR